MCVEKSSGQETIWGDTDVLDLYMNIIDKVRLIFLELHLVKKAVIKRWNEHIILNSFYAGPEVL